MQLTTINKVVSLFLIGGLVIMAVVCVSWEKLDQALSQGGALYSFLESKGQALLVLAGALSLLSLASAVGAVVDTLTGLTVRHWLVKSASHRWLAVCLGQKHSFDDFDFWRERFRFLVENREPYKSFVPEIRDHEITMAAAIFFKTGSQGLISWAESHYAVFVYATNLVFLSILMPIALLIWGGHQALGWSLGSYIVLGIVLALLFSGMAIDKFLYTHEVSFRQAALVLLEEKPVPGSGEEAHNTYEAPGRQGVNGP